MEKEVNYKKSSAKIIKIILVVIIALLVIGICSTWGIFGAKYYKQKILETKKIQEYQNILDLKLPIDSQENIFSEQTINEKKINKLLPVYSEEAKQKMHNIYNGEEKIVYLTFDDGPSQAVTPLILDLLKKEEIKATFFLLGSSVKQNPELVQREYEEGHYLANHGYSHKYSSIYAKPSNVIDEYNKTEKEIQKAIENEEYHSHLFRFPGGYYGGKYFSIKKEAAKLLNENEISYIDWNNLTGDAEGANTKEKIMENVKKYTDDKNVIILLMHDAAAKILTYETLPEVIHYFRGNGYSFDNFYTIMQ